LSSPTIPKLQASDSWLLLNDEEASWVGSLTALGTVAGPFLGGWLMDHVGRRRSIILSVVISLVAWLVLLTAESLWQLYVGRVIGGIGGGIAFWCVLCMLQKSLKGALGSMFAFFLVGGYLIDLTPESPYYFLRKNDYASASDSLTWLRSGRKEEEVQKEINEIQTEVRLSMEEKAHLSDLVATRGNRMGLLLACGMVAGQQISGVNATEVRISMEEKAHLSDLVATRGNRMGLLLACGMVAGQQISGTEVRRSMEERAHLSDLVATRGNRMGLLLACGMVAGQQISGVNATEVRISMEEKAHLSDLVATRGNRMGLLLACGMVAGHRSLVSTLSCSSLNISINAWLCPDRGAQIYGRTEVRRSMEEKAHLSDLVATRGNRMGLLLACGMDAGQQISGVNATEVRRSMEERAHLSDLVATRGNRMGLLLACGMVAGQQISGVNAVLFYGQSIFIMAGTSFSSSVSTLILGIMLFVAGGFAIPFSRYFGMKKMFIFSAVGMAIFQAILGVYFYLMSSSHDMSAYGYVPVTSLVLFIFCYTMGFGPLPWAVMAEVFPSNVKALAAAITASFCWLLGFVITKFFNSVSDHLGAHFAFFIFSACCVAALLFTIFVLPDTRGLTLQEILDLLNKTPLVSSQQKHVEDQAETVS
ncbi:facilitated trehalose transporter Tret1-like, partial [Macrosteles quadrilineatus]|uniref:facilitated trehalose transporter Tret1-like n=1 Tax=Macrosteles quadrilineatus TaxID=74068 RepID=UPI0023E29247